MIEPAPVHIAVQTLPAGKNSTLHGVVFQNSPIPADPVDRIYAACETNQKFVPGPGYLDQPEQAWIESGRRKRAGAGLASLGLALQRAVETIGVEFIDENGGGWGVCDWASVRVYERMACAFRPPRSIDDGASSREIRWAARSRQRLASMDAPSASSVESRTISTLRSMPSCDQPRE